MEYNLHPIFVHFPIAFLTLYSLVVLLPLQRWFPTVNWKNFRTILLAIGVVALFAAKASGEGAEDITRASDDLVDAHEAFANATTFMYVSALVFELWPWIYRKAQEKRIGGTILRIFDKIFRAKWLLVLLALGGLLAITLTGMVGGIMVHGTSADPLAPLLLEVLGMFD